jgi:hypothetical protein
MLTGAITRRGFVKRAAAAAATAWAAPAIVPASVLGADPKTPAPSQRISVGMIGMGRQAQLVNMRQFLGMPDVAILAVCDIDAWRLDRARQAVEEEYGKRKATSRTSSTA